MDRNAAITAMTLANLVSADGGIGLANDPRWPEVDDLAAELGLSGPNAVVHASEPPAGGQPGSGARTAGAVLCAHADDDGRGGHWLAPGQRCDTDREARTVSDVSQLPGSARNAQALARHVKAALLHVRQAEDLAELAGIDVDASEHDVPEAGVSGVFIWARIDDQRQRSFVTGYPGRLSGSRRHPRPYPCRTPVSEGP